MLAKCLFAFSAVSFAISVGAAVLRAESPLTANKAAAASAAPVSLPKVSLPNVALTTLGGEQVWSDELVQGAWRVQRNVLTGHCRLLDDQDVRRAWGSSEQCLEALTAANKAESRPPLDGRAVVTLHGFGRSRDHMAGIGAFLAEQTGCAAINVTYASTRRTLDEHAAALAGVIAGLEGIDDIDFVCHSMGNLVLRRYLGERDAEQPRWQVDPRVRRIVMLGPPNNGACVAGLLADLLDDNLLIAKLVGPSAMQLARDWQTASKLLATPHCEFGVVAGGCSDEHGFNPLLAGDDDLVVTVGETRLVGACDFRLVHCRHGRLMDDAVVRQYVLSFLQHGYFTAAGERQPILAAASTEQRADEQPADKQPADEQRAEKR